MQILFADFVEGADNPTLHDGPKAFDCVGMNGPTDIFPASMMDHAMRNGSKTVLKRLGVSNGFPVLI